MIDQLLRHSVASRCRVVTLVVLVLASIQGCATLRPTQSLEDRVQAKWDALVAGDIARVYEYLSPGYRAIVSLPEYQADMARRTVRWTDARFKDIFDCDRDDSCKIRVTIFYEVTVRVPGGGKFKSDRTVQESWIKLDGQWYFVPQIS